MVEWVLLRVGGVAGLTGVEPLLAASLAHVLPQYGCTLVPSLNCGFCLQCYGIQIRQ